MNYRPRDEKELRSALVLPAGVYDFEVIGARETVSKKNNDMIELELQIFVPDGTTRQVKDWLVPGSDLGDLKLNRFAHATGLQDEYFGGGLSDALCRGAVGKCKLGIDSDPQWGDQNKVKGYVVAKPEEETEVDLRPDLSGPSGQQQKAAREAARLTNEEIPF